jgi:hypothetical protein
MERSYLITWIRWIILSGLLCLTSILCFLTTNVGGMTSHLLYLPIVRKALPANWDGRILISEVMYDPIGREPDGEWIELYNSGRISVDLSDKKIGDAWFKGDREGMMRFPKGTIIESKQVLVIANRGDIFLDNYGRLPDLEMVNTLPDLDVMIMYLPWANRMINLANSGDEVLILNEVDERIDEVSWGTSHLAFSPPAIKAPEGCSIERYPYYVDTDSAKDWRVQCNPSPGDLDYTPPTPVPVIVPTPSFTITPTSTIQTPENGSYTATPITPTPFTATPKTPTNTKKPPRPVLVINEIYAHPLFPYGDANGDGEISNDDQFIELVNVSEFDGLLDGWSIWNSEGIQHEFPAGTIVPAGAAILIFGGGYPEGDFGGSQWQLATSLGLFLIPNGDTVYIYDGDGNLAASYTYGDEGEKQQSITRYPDVAGLDPLILHMEHPDSGGARFSPGTKADGTPFQEDPLMSKAK